MRRALVAGAVALLLAGCGLAGDPTGSVSPTSTRTSPTATPLASRLLARPLKLATVPPGSACPVTGTANRDVGIGNPRGRGPFYLGGGMPQGNFPWNKTVWVLVDGAHGPILFRGGRLDGTGSLRFSGSPADPSDRGLTLSSAGGVSATFYERMLGEGDGEGFYVYPATAGCYALQVDGASFEDVIVIPAG